MFSNRIGTLALIIGVAAAFPTAHAASPGAVFVMTNGADQNEVIAYARGEDGHLQERARYNTEGRGSGGQTDPLQSQGSLTLSPDNTLLYVVNAGSGSISTFRVHGPNLSLVGKAPAGGAEPVAITQWGNLVYVVNAGAAGQLVGFTVDAGGHLKQIPNSTTFLSGKYTGAASVSISPDGKFLVVVERAANTISTFPINPDGTLGAIVATMSPGPGAFSGLFAPGDVLVVTETGAVGTVPDSALSTYAVSGSGIVPITQSAPTYGEANCWSAITPNGQYVYADNSASGTISGFSIGTGGVLTPIGDTVLATLPAGSANLDNAISSDGAFLYTLNSGTGAISILQIAANGTLTLLGERGGLTPNAGYNGIAAF
jgi:6-phosphogluconolactonase